jgi:LuxR family maltose regulon positive regulatory protein
VNTSSLFQDQLLTTKFFLPSPSRNLIDRPRLTALLNEGLRYKLTLVSAPAGFGKTTLLSSWVRTLPKNNPAVAWLSLDEEDNDLILFWTYIFTALDNLKPGFCLPFLESLQKSQMPHMRYILQSFINKTVEENISLLLVLDDYHLITNSEVHTSLLFLVDHLPNQLHIILATRMDPPLALTQLRARAQMLEIRTDQLRCTTEEASIFLNDVMHLKLTTDVIQKVSEHAEGWLVGLQLFGLSLQGRNDLNNSLQEMSGNQRYIMDYLTDEVLRRQPQEIQDFLFRTSILDRLHSSLCDAVLEQHNSQKILEDIEQANLFIEPLDAQRGWYRYHALFAEVLRYRLKQSHQELLPGLHYRASIWNAEHNNLPEAILHAFSAHQWEWAADLIERLPFSPIWGTDTPKIMLLRKWLEQLPVEVVQARPRLCLACAAILSTVAPPRVLETWLDMAEAGLTKSLDEQDDEQRSSQEEQYEKNLLGEVVAFRAYLHSFQEQPHDTLELSEKALSLLTPQNWLLRAQVAFSQMLAYFHSDANDAEAACLSGERAGHFAQISGHVDLAAFYNGGTAYYLTAAGRLHEAQRLSRQVMQLEHDSNGVFIPAVGWAYTFQADVLREWNRLDDALDLALQGIAIGRQIGFMSYLFCGYMMLIHVYLSRGDMDAAYAALQTFDRLGMQANPQMYIHIGSFYTIIDRVKIWLGRGELQQAINWMERLEIEERKGAPFTAEREEVACARILLAQQQPVRALQRLEPVLKRAQAGKRGDHVLEVLLLQSLAYSMNQQEQQALQTLAQAVQLAEPEGYIRRFVDEGNPMATLLTKLRTQQRRSTSIPYLDVLLHAFAQQSLPNEYRVEQPAPQAATQTLYQEPLSERELEVLQILARGAPNQQIAQELVITVTTVKRHVSHIFAKLGVTNRVQAITRARELDLIDEHKTE